jgi:hypothetical protein
MAVGLLVLLVEPVTAPPAARAELRSPLQIRQDMLGGTAAATSTLVGQERRAPAAAVDTEVLLVGLVQPVPQAVMVVNGTSLKVPEAAAAAAVTEILQLRPGVRADYTAGAEGAVDTALPLALLVVPLFKALSALCMCPSHSRALPTTSHQPPRDLGMGYRQQPHGTSRS